MRKFLAVAAVLALVGPFAFADDARPTFEAATVKRNNSGPGPSRLVFQPGGRISVMNLPLRTNIAAAYGTPQPLAEFQLVGGPNDFDLTYTEPPTED